MTREELADAIQAALGVFDVDNLGPCMYVEPILALFDRFEAEKWSKPGESPAGPMREIVVCEPRTGHRFSRIWLEADTWADHWIYCELPPPPAQEEGR